MSTNVQVPVEDGAGSAVEEIGGAKCAAHVRRAVARGDCVIVAGGGAQHLGGTKRCRDVAFGSIRSSFGSWWTLFVGCVVELCADGG